MQETGNSAWIKAIARILEERECGERSPFSCLLEERSVRPTELGTSKVISAVNCLDLAGAG